MIKFDIDWFKDNVYHGVICDCKSELMTLINILKTDYYCDTFEEALSFTSYPIVCYFDKSYGNGEIRFATEDETEFTPDDALFRDLIFDKHTIVISEKEIFDFLNS